MKKILLLVCLFWMCCSGYVLAQTQTPPVQVTLLWDARPASEGVVRYGLFIGTESGVYPIKAVVPVGTEQFTFGGLLYNTEYFFAATATDQAGNESGYSPEVSYTTRTEPDTVSPGSPTIINIKNAEITVTPIP